MSLALAPAVVVQRSTPMRDAIEIVVHHPPSAAAVKPGQFFQLAVAAPQTILRRPYSAAWADPQGGRIGFIFNVVGAGSGWLAVRHEGHELDLLGPLGRGFSLEGERPVICMAGGLGVAVFPGVVQALVTRKRRVTMLLGARTSSQLLPADRFTGADVLTATDDGSAGYHGSVVNLFTSTLRGRVGVEAVDILTCGPTPMLQALIENVRQLGLPLESIQVALETPMGCGVGTCLGCAIPRAGGGYLLSCIDGPCVRADRIDWGRMTDAFHG